MVTRYIVIDFSDFCYGQRSQRLSDGCPFSPSATKNIYNISNSFLEINFDYFDFVIIYFIFTYIDIDEI